MISSHGGISGLIYSSSSVCGNNFCENDESIGNCAIDCLTGCGDNICEGIEEELCPEDCAYAPRTVYFRLSNIILVSSSILAILIMVYWIQPKETKVRKTKKRKTQRKKRKR